MDRCGFINSIVSDTRAHNAKLRLWESEGSSVNSSHACLFTACGFMIQLTLEDRPSAATSHFLRVACDRQHDEESVCDTFTGTGIIAAETGLHLVPEQHNLHTWPAITNLYKIRCLVTAATSSQLWVSQRDDRGPQCKCQCFGVFVSNHWGTHRFAHLLSRMNRHTEINCGGELAEGHGVDLRYHAQPAIVQMVIHR